MQNPFSLSQNRTFVKFAIIFMIINAFCIYIFFNGSFFITIDNALLSSKFILLAIGISWVSFFIGLKFLKFLSPKRLFLIFIIVRMALFIYFLLANYAIDLDLGQTWLDMVHHIINGSLFTPYSSNPSLDLWRMNPPLLMWWYTYNFFLYDLNAIGWRILNLLLEIGIFYMIITIFQEITHLKENLNENNFKVGLLFYIFSIFPIVSFILYPTIIAFPILLAQIGIYYYLKSKTSPNYLYHSILFFSLCAFTVYQAGILLIGIICLLIFQKAYKQIIFGLIEILGIFCLISLPMLINDALGFIQRLLVIPELETSVPNSTYWLFDQNILKIALLLFISLVIYFYFSETIHRMKTLDFFIILISIMLLFSPFIYPWTFLWILPFISISLMYNFKKYLQINIIFSSYMFLYYLFFAILFLLSPIPLNPNHYDAFIQILNFGASIGVLQLFQIFFIPIFQMGLIYIIYTLTKSKSLIFILLFPCLIFITSNFLIWLGSLVYPPF